MRTGGANTTAVVDKPVPPLLTLIAGTGPPDIKAAPAGSLMLIPGGLGLLCCERRTGANANAADQDDAYMSSKK